MAIFIEAGGGCQANDPGYWRAERRDSEGGVILACGATESEAEGLVEESLIDRERFLALNAREQLREIAAKDRILSSDMERAIRLINKLL